MLQPAMRPPPPQGSSAASGVVPIARSCAAASSPAVPWPAMMRGSSYGFTRAAPVRRAISAPISSRTSRSRSYSRISAPSARVLAILIAGASAGMTMVAGTPRSLAAAATPWAWLPEEKATTGWPSSWLMAL